MDNKLDKLIELNNVGYTAIFAFIVLNLILISFTLFSTYITNQYYQKIKNLIQLAYHIVVFVLLILVSFSVSTTKCGLYSSFDSINAITSAIISFVFVFSAGTIFLYLFPGWIRGFSNTFGLSALYLSNYKEFLQKNFLNDRTNNSVFQKLYDDPLPLFNELIPDFTYDEENDLFKWNSFSNFQSMMNKQFPKKFNSLYDKRTHNLTKKQNTELENQIAIKESTEKIAIKELAEKIATKEFIGYTIWYTALGCISILFTVIQSLDTKCVRDPTESAEFRAYTAKKFDEV